MGKGKIIATNNEGANATTYQFNLIKQGANDPAPGHYPFDTQPSAPSLTSCYSCGFTGTTAAAQAKSATLAVCPIADCS